MEFIFPILIIIVVLSMNTNSYKLIKNKKKGVIVMPKEMIKDYIGKHVSITVFNNAFAFNGILESFEGNWIKVSTKKNIQIINIDHIQSIVISK